MKERITFGVGGLRFIHNDTIPLRDTFGLLGVLVM